MDNTIATELKKELLEDLGEKLRAINAAAISEPVPDARQDIADLERWAEVRAELFDQTARTLRMHKLGFDGPFEYLNPMKGWIKLPDGEEFQPATHYRVYYLSARVKRETADMAEIIQHGRNIADAVMVARCRIGSLIEIYRGDEHCWQPIAHSTATFKGMTLYRPLVPKKK